MPPRKMPKQPRWQREREEAEWGIGGVVEEEGTMSKTRKVNAGLPGGMRGLTNPAGMRMTTTRRDNTLLSPGLPQDWEPVPRKQPRRNISDLSLMDAVHEFLFKGEASTQNIRTRQRALLRKAERFVLDDETVKLVCHLSHETDKLIGWSFLARLPYDTMWIELDLHVKVAELQAMGTLRGPFNPEEVSPKLGLLLTKDTAGNDLNIARWVCHYYQYLTINDGEVSPGLIATVFDPEGEAATPVEGSALWRQPTLSRLPNFPPMTIKAPGLDEVKVDPEFLICGGFEHGYRSQEFVPTWYTNRNAVIIEPYQLARFPERQRKRLYPHVIDEVKELLGHQRWIMTLLATINGLPRDVRPIASRPGVRHVGMYKLPYLRHSVISLKVPRDDRIVYARKRLDHEAHEARRPWHRVMGHWRVVERGKKITHLCRHQPTMVEHGLGMCERCEMMIRWVPDHGRGDPNIGIMNHDAYQVLGKKYHEMPDLMPHKADDLHERQ